MFFTSQAPCYGFSMGNQPIRKIKTKKIKLRVVKNDKIKKAVKEQVKKITTKPKSYND